MNVKDNHKPMILFIINDYENFFIWTQKFSSDDSQFLQVPFNWD